MAMAGKLNIMQREGKGIRFGNWNNLNTDCFEVIGQDFGWLFFFKRLTESIIATFIVKLKLKQELVI